MAPLLSVLLPLILLPFSLPKQDIDPIHPDVLSESTIINDIDGFFYRDLNKNSLLDDYEDCRLDIEVRIENLLRQMTLEEKAGLMFIDGAFFVPFDGSIDSYTTFRVTSKFMNHFGLFQFPSIQTISKWNNNIQRLAESTRLGIPITIASDPRHHIGNFGSFTQILDTKFSEWCQQLGLAAIGDPNLIEVFASVASKEYQAVGIREALHPQVDLATEPRWPRISGTFGEDAELASKLLKPYIEGHKVLTRINST